MTCLLGIKCQIILKSRQSRVQEECLDISRNLQPCEINLNLIPVSEDINCFKITA